MRNWQQLVRQRFLVDCFFRDWLSCVLMLGDRKLQPLSSVRSLLDVLGDEELSAKEMMDRLGLSHRPTFQTAGTRSIEKLDLVGGAIKMTDQDQENNLAGLS
ncbi:MAG: hypothetical protein LKE39_01545 [Sphaerochaeta sp.]|jgi:hypothetical protein|nr:hypothetical protein [Sphaerochaeta sp.]